MKLTWAELEKKLRLKNFTDFQISVYQATTQIPAGKTCSYGEIASAIGRAGSARAVGSALRKNPFPGPIPCHRVIHANGLVTGFMGSMNPNSKENLKKKLLLKNEGAL